MMKKEISSLKYVLKNLPCTSKHCDLYIFSNWQKNNGFNIVWFLKLFKDELLLCLNWGLTFLFQWRGRFITNFDSIHQRMYHWFTLNCFQNKCIWDEVMPEFWLHYKVQLYFGMIWNYFICALQEVKIGSCDIMNASSKSFL